MKKIWRQIAVLLAALMIVTGTFGCGSSSAANPTSNATAKQETIVETPTEADIPVFTDDRESETSDTETIAAEDTAEEDNSDLKTKEENPTEEDLTKEEPQEAGSNELLDIDGSYDSKEEVALYLHTYGQLPQNYITKKEAEKLGWSGGSLEPYAPGKCIGGSNFGNYEGVLPKGKYHECDIDTIGAKKRGAKRIVYSDSGEIYYTEDHYESFTLLYDADGPVEQEITYP